MNKHQQIWMVVLIAVRRILGQFHKPPPSPPTCPPRTVPLQQLLTESLTSTDSLLVLFQSQPQPIRANGSDQIRLYQASRLFSLNHGKAKQSQHLSLSLPSPRVNPSQPDKVAGHTQPQIIATPIHSTQLPFTSPSQPGTAADRVKEPTAAAQNQSKANLLTQLQHSKVPGLILPETSHITAPIQTQSHQTTRPSQPLPAKNQCPTPTSTSTSTSGSTFQCDGIGSEERRGHATHTATREGRLCQASERKVVPCRKGKNNSG